MSKGSTTKKWIQDHTSDYYVLQANKLGYRSRASFKILEIQDKYNLFKQNMFIVDLGAAPGGWSEQVVKFIGNNGKLIALDLLEMAPIAGVEFIQGDFSSDETYERLTQLINDKKIDCVISDMAPNLSGNKTSDQARSIHLLELALDFATTNLNRNGSFVAKVFQGQGSDEYLKLVRESFNKVTQFKPKSSRPKSREFYVVATGFKG
ncbi:RlmE family RNA methyltransferase [Francisella philomiragia]|uniref:RlmE family RNA methyltransferase n=1 Tax=Francisella philomiragia TaxID=28110 RepID=UPI001908CD7E|nr:SAM-dependent methyltransferase [Francisella philomiragia]MBK2092404.1 23S rRNA methyltransferase [Francisella philomiragia]MBK2257290.1 23S rRNA methyltransferase [Francisella philomiragia]MBK2269947.1 23S rRNA methyltransferase [Francisella philomiragia]MBK2271707.1 23S rRNA methyltransferase [Francisella philomiragia]MBK2275666.1 23S rRNA methyltransferase [Francisella philomiragia]